MEKAGGQIIYTELRVVSLEVEGETLKGFVRQKISMSQVVGPR